MASLRFTSELWAPEHGKWRFVTVPLGLSEEIADLANLRLPRFEAGLLCAPGEAVGPAGGGY